MDFCPDGFLGEQCMAHNHEAIDPTCVMYPLYDSRWEHDACGTGFLAQISGEASHALVQTALEALARLTHRGAQDADAGTYDGAGILIQIPKALVSEELAVKQDDVAIRDGLACGISLIPSHST